MEEKALSRKGQATRQKILDEATRAFARHGYAGTRLDQIAGELGLTRQAVLFYFKDKSSLYEATMAELFKVREHPQEMRGRDSFDDLGEYVDYLVSDAVGYYLEHPEFARMLMRFLMAQGPASAEPHPAASAMVDRWQGVVREGSRSGQTRKVPASNLVALIGGTLSYYILLPDGARSGSTLMKYDPYGSSNIRHMTHNLQRAVRGMLGLPTED